VRAALMQCFHESNVFTPIRNGLDDFRKRYWIEGTEVENRFRGTKNWLGGVLRGLDELGAETNIGLCVASHPGGRVEASAFREIRRAMLDSLRRMLDKKPVDMVMLLLHGALAAEGSNDPEGEIAGEVRTMIGLKTVLACTVDFHANVSPLLSQASDLIIGGREYPHLDAFERGLLAARLAEVKVKGRGIHTWSFKLPLLTPLAAQSTVSAGPMAEINRALGPILERYRLDDVAVLGGFPYIDAPWAGTGVLVTGDNADLAVGAFREISRLVLYHRDGLAWTIPRAEEVLPEVFSAAERGTVVLADIGDNPGSGGTADDVTILRFLLSGPAEFSAGIFVDPEAAREAQRAGAGNRVRVLLGGKHDNGPSLEIDAVVEKAGPFAYRNKGTMMTGELLDGGLGAVLRIRNGYILVASERIQAYDAEAFDSQGVPTSGNRIIMVKSSGHFRASFEPRATAGIFLADSLGWSSSRLSALPYVRVDKRRLLGGGLTEAEWESETEREIARVFSAFRKIANSS